MVLSVPDNTFVLGWIKVIKIMVLQFTSRGLYMVFTGHRGVVKLLPRGGGEQTSCTHLLM